MFLLSLSHFHHILVCLLIISLGSTKTIKKTRRLCTCMDEISSNLTDPLIIENAGDSTNRLFVGEQGGVIYVLDKSRTRNAEPFLNISNQVITGGERGLLGLAFHPDYDRNRRFFVYYSSKATPKDPTDDHITRLCEFKTSRSNHNKADRSSEKLILEFQQPYSNHNGGQLIFGEDGYLYVFTGDGGSAGDPPGNAQNTSSFLGKVLRIDIDQRSRTVRYRIPHDNPFVGNKKFRPEIYAYGLRNPWRCGKDPGLLYKGRSAKNGWILCGDVGQNKYEEIDLIRPGANYGWNAEEGPVCYDDTLCGKIGKTTEPVFSYTHEVGSSVIGGQFYRGCQNPRLRKFYIFGDFVSGKLFVSKPTRTLRVWRAWELRICKRCKKPLTNEFQTSFTSFGLDEYGEIYVTSFGGTGKLYKIVDPFWTKKKSIAKCRAKIWNMWEKR